MAKKKESTFDPDKFLDTYEEGVPCATTGTSPESVSKPQEQRQSASSTDRELDYLQKYVHQKKYISVIRKGKQVAVCDEFKVKIQKLLLFFSDGGTITSYVNNVLEQHFREYDDVIQRMFNDTKI